MADKILTITELIKELNKYKFTQLHIHHTWKPTHRDFNGRSPCPPARDEKLSYQYQWME